MFWRPRCVIYVQLLSVITFSDFHLKEHVLLLFNIIIITVCVSPGGPVQRGGVEVSSQLVHHGAL